MIHGTPADEGLAYTPYTVTTVDGVKLQAWLLHAQAPRQNATILHFHGNADNRSSHYYYVAWLAQLGFDVVTFDYRGYGGSEGTPSRAGLAEDGWAMIEFVRGTPALAKQPLIVFGQSLGGAVAVPVVAARKAGEVSMLAVEATFDSYRGLARGKLGSFWLTWPLQWPLSFLVSDELSPEDAAPKLRLPLLVMHGKVDPVVPNEYGRRLFDDAVNARPREFWELDLPQHAGAFVDPDSRVRPRFLAFVCRALKRACPQWEKDAAAP